VSVFGFDPADARLCPEFLPDSVPDRLTSTHGATCRHPSRPQIENLRSAAGRTAVEINDLGRAATFGAVEALFVDIDAKLSGTIDEETGAVSLDEVERPGDYGVVDELCRRVILADGRVLAVRADEFPGGGPAAAILRYPV
jgi:hypothetical protein